MEPWQVIDVQAWQIVAAEPRGKRRKAWVMDDRGVHWLRKEALRAKQTDPAVEPPIQRPNEIAIEALMLRLAAEAGLPAAEARVCTWTDTEPRRGIVSRSFLAGDESLSQGGDELSAEQGYDPGRHELHTPDRVRNVLRRLEDAHGVPLLQPFLRMLAYDAWTGNGDRHQENWAVLRAHGKPTRLAPLYDHAACLGAELADGARWFRPDQDLAKYIHGCPSGFGNGTKLVRQPELIAILTTWPEWRAEVRGWIDSFHSAMNTFPQVIEQVSADWLSAERTAFALRLLRARLEWLAKWCGA